MDKYYEKYMKIALKEAEKAYFEGEIPIGAVIVKDNKIIARGHNTKEKMFDPTCHAEIVAIRRACKKLKNWRLNDCSMFITLFPCPMCASAINQSRFSKIIFGAIPEYANKQMIYDILGDNKYGNSVEIVENVLENECLSIIKKFFDKKR